MFRDAPSDLKQIETKAATSYYIIINLFHAHFITKTAIHLVIFILVVS